MEDMCAVMSVHVSALSICVNMYPRCVHVCVSNGYLLDSVLVWLYVSSGMWVCQHAVSVSLVCTYECLYVSALCACVCQCMHECAHNSLLDVCFSFGCTHLTLTPPCHLGRGDKEELPGTWV